MTDEDRFNTNSDSDSDLSWKSMSPVTSDEDCSGDSLEDSSAMISDSSDNEEHQSNLLDDLTSLSTSTITSVSIPQQSSVSMEFENECVQGI